MSTETDLEIIKRRVRKLLALSGSPNEHEAAAALEKAQKIMDEYRLSKSECLYTLQSATATKRLSRWRTVLANAVAWLYCCETFRNAERGEMCFFGESLDVLMAAEMYACLAKTVERMAKQNIRKTAKGPFREKYKLGTACRLWGRIRDMGEAVSWAPERGRRLFAVTLERENQITLETKDLKLAGKGSDAFRRGAEAGNGVSLNRQATGNGGRYLEVRW